MHETYETNETIQPLSKIRQKERDEFQAKLEEDAKLLLEKAINFYDINYPASTHNKIWITPKILLKIGKKSLQEELDKLDEKELGYIFEIFRYFHDERQMNKIEEHNLYNRILARIRKISPGGHFLEKLYELYDKRDALNKEIEELEQKLDDQREIFEKKLDKTKRKKIPDSEEKLITCEMCGKICRTEAGLSSHLRIHNKNDKK